MSKSTFVNPSIWGGFDATSKASVKSWMYQAAVGLLAAFGALLITLPARPVIQDSKFIFFIVAIILASWYGGVLSGIITSLLGIVFVDFFVMAPEYEISFYRNPLTLLQAVLFFAVTLLITWMQSRRLSAEREAQILIAQRDAILNGVADGITAQSSDGNFVFVNRAAADITGYPSPQAMLNSGEAHRMRTLWEMFNVDGQPLTAENLPRVIVFREGKPVERLFLARQKDTGEERWLHVVSTPMFDQQGKVQFALNVFRDVTLQRKSERELLDMTKNLRAQTERLDNLISNIPGIIWESTALGEGKQRIDFVNDYAERVLGYTPEEWRTTPDFFRTIMHPDDVEYARQRATEIFASNKAGSIQVRFVAKDGRVVHVETHTSYELKPDNSATVYGVIMDITERKQYEEALSEYAANLRRSNEELEQFAYIASHDLQEPLRMMTSYLQLIEQRYKDKLDDDGREFIQFAVDGSTRMKSLINDLLMYSRVQRKRADFKSVSLGKIFERVLENLQLSIEDSQAAITSDALPTLYGDEGQLTQLFQNLISNGIKFHRDEPPVVHVGVKRLRRQWEFSVQDNGIGIETQYIDRIFVIFQRLHTKDKYPGTGIGLAICKKVVENHRGRIWVESAPGKGATFFFTLPIGNGAGLEDDTDHGIHH